ncbi:MAG TPA: carboxypeptidase-like regulatory domain-containing protein [Gemmataceae bacterium]
MRRCWFCALVLVVAAGCGSGGGPELPVNGVVTMDGTPLDGATVVFYPEEKGGAFGTGVTGSDGKFVIARSEGKSGLAPGKYKVTVSKMSIPQREGEPSPEDPAAVGAVTEAELQADLPPHYSDPAKTVLSYSVTGDGKPIEIKLSSKPPKR